jgi:hypothetical protein
MKILQVVPRRDAKKSLTAALNEKERELRDSGTVFVPPGPANGSTSDSGAGSTGKNQTGVFSLPR